MIRFPTYVNMTGNPGARLLTFVWISLKLRYRAQDQAKRSEERSWYFQTAHHQNGTPGVQLRTATDSPGHVIPAR
jgi:hypothetical protein